VELKLGIRPLPPRPPAETRTAPVPPPKTAPMPSVTQIEQLRKKAMEVWSPPVDIDDDQDFQFLEEDPEPAPGGWAKSEYNPSKLVELFHPLRLKKRVRVAGVRIPREWKRQRRGLGNARGRQVSGA
jgi:hypothetical protein